MVSSTFNQIKVESLSLTPGVHIWYSEIPYIIHTLFNKDCYDNYHTRLNEKFSNDDFTIDILNPDEMRMLNGFKAMKKQVEWLSGRFLIKHLAKHFCLPDLLLKDIGLEYHDQGAPYIAAQPGISISLSHSHGLTAAAVSLNKGQTIGIDLEQLKKMPDPYFLKTAFTRKEIKQFGNNANLVFKNWTIKEAFLKYIKKGFNESLHHAEVIDGDIYHHKKHVNLDIKSVRINKAYYLSIVSD